MAITTLNGIIAGLQPTQEIVKVGATVTAGRKYSPFYVAGRPAAATAPSTGVSGAALTTYAGQIPFPTSVTGNTYLARFEASTNLIGSVTLCDRLWHNSGIVVTVNTAQAINSITFPARDMSGTTNGEGVMIAVEVSTVMGAGTPTWTMTYTNSQGVSGRIVTTAAQATTMAVGSFIPIQLASGDTGVQSIQTWRQSATMTSGVYHLVAYRVIARVDNAFNFNSSLDFSLDALTCGFPLMYPNSVPFLLFYPQATTGPQITARVTYSQG